VQVFYWPINQLKLIYVSSCYDGHVLIKRMFELNKFIRSSPRSIVCVLDGKKAGFFNLEKTATEAHSMPETLYKSRTML